MKTIEPVKIAQQILDFQKTAFDNTFNAMLMMQGQTEKMADAFMGQNSMIPEESQKMISEWMLACKKGQDDFKKNIDDNFKKLESFFSENAGNAS